ncbi:endonuclease/exonuclease/phosphatase family protein [Candidatus Woesearchaeota archaeon]|nr:endonuclease/exonuclease/phosphatase family protein [Candidatus Woesearchaeota archaeon]
MRAKKIKIMTLNIHNYHNFTLRRPRIIALFKKYNPDIIALQEIRDDGAKNKPGMDQAKQLNEKLNFKYFRFLRVNNRNKAKGLVNLPPCYEGMAILSKFPFSSREITLKKHKDDTYCRKILIANINTGVQIIPVWVVHFSNNDLFARLHSEETLNHAQLTQPIILGDFNIKYPSDIKKLAEKNNYISSSYYKYVSFPEDNCSYDYIFIPARYSFLRFKCIPQKVSDHKALFAEINL